MPAIGIYFTTNSFSWMFWWPPAVCFFHKTFKFYILLIKVLLHNSIPSQCLIEFLVDNKVYKMFFWSDIWKFIIYKWLSSALWKFCGEICSAGGYQQLKKNLLIVKKVNCWWSIAIEKKSVDGEKSELLVVISNWRKICCWWKKVNCWWSSAIEKNLLVVKN